MNPMENRIFALLIGAIGVEAITLSLLMLLMNAGGLLPLAFMLLSVPFLAYCIDRICKL